MVENRLGGLFWHVERKLVDFVVRRVDQIEDSQITKEKLLRKIYDRNMVYDRTLWHNLIHVTDPT